MTMARRGCLDRLGTSGRWSMALTKNVPLMLSLSKDGVQAEQVDG
ncbi:hypothetical protein SAMN05518801_101244 [Novosphingobium sp. CF614]|nr:hypothetical protein SAMN05518801_101244 [Novosphingobium sp. CF614]